MRQMMAEHALAFMMHLCRSGVAGAAWYTARIGPADQETGGGLGTIEEELLLLGSGQIELRSGDAGVGDEDRTLGGELLNVVAVPFAGHGLQAAKAFLERAVDRTVGGLRSGLCRQLDADRGPARRFAVRAVEGIDREVHQHAAVHPGHGPRSEE